MLFVLPQWVTIAAALVAAAIAAVRGGRVERVVAAATLADIAWSRLRGLTYGQDLTYALAHDIVAAVLMTVLALRTNRYWILAAASIWLVSAATEVAQLIAAVDPWAFGTAELVWYQLFLLALAVGSWRTVGGAPTAAQRTPVRM